MKPNENLAVKLAEKGMACKRLDTYKDFKLFARKVGLKLENEEDLSNYVMPNLFKLEKIARQFFVYPRVAKLSTNILPDPFTLNAISGYLMPSLVRNKTFCYMETVFIKT